MEPPIPVRPELLHAAHSVHGAVHRSRNLVVAQAEPVGGAGLAAGGRLRHPGWYRPEGIPPMLGPRSEPVQVSHTRRGRT